MDANNLTLDQEAAVAKRRAERAIILVTSLAHFLCHVAEVMFPCVLLAVREEFHLVPDEATMLALLGYVLLGAGALPVGAWADWWEPKKIMSIYFVMLAVAGLGVALATTPWLLFLALTGLGLAASIYHPTGLTMISLGVERRTMAMGINGVFGSLGVGLAPLLAWVALHGLGDWRWAYGLLAAMSLLGAMVMVVVGKRTEDRRQKTEDREQKTEGRGQRTGWGSGGTCRFWF